MKQQKRNQFFLLIIFLYLGDVKAYSYFSTLGRGDLYTIESLIQLSDAISQGVDGSYEIHTDIQISNGIKPDILKLEPGTSLKFVQNATLKIDGVLIAVGTGTAPITFKAVSEKWTGIIFSSKTDSNACILQHVRIENAQIGISCQRASPQITSSQIDNCYQHAILVFSSTPTVSGNSFSNHRGNTIIHIDSSQVDISQNTFNLQDWQTAIRLIKSNSHIRSNQFNGGKTAISFRHATPQIERNHISHCTIGIYADQSTPIIRRNQFFSTQTAISIWNCNEGSINKNIIEKSRYEIYSKNSNLIMDTKLIPLGEKRQRQQPKPIPTIEMEPKTTQNPDNPNHKVERKPKPKQPSSKQVNSEESAKMNQIMDNLFSIGKSHFKKEQYDQALTNYNRLLDLVTGDEEELANAYYHRALTHYELGNYHQVIEDVQTLLGINPTPKVELPAKLILAKSATQNNMVKLAEKTFQELKSKNQYHQSSLIELANLYEKNELYQKAIQSLEEFSLALKDRQTLITTIMRMANICYQQQNFPKAIGYYQELIGNFPEAKDLDTIQYAIGECWNAEEEVEKAILAYEKLINNYPDSKLAISAKWNVATLNHQIDQSANAFHYTKKIIDQYTQSSVSSDQQIVYAARNLATKLLLENTTLISDPNPLLIENLVAVTNFPLATAEVRSNALFELGNLYTSTKNLDEAISSYEQANEETQSNEMKNTILFRLAIIYFDVEDYEKFIPSASKLLDPNLVLNDEMTLQLYFRLGLGHLELQQTDQAKSAFAQVLLIPNVSGEIHTQAHFYLAGIHQTNQQLDLAKTEYRLVLSALGENTSDPALRKIRSESAFQLALLIEDANLYDQAISANLDPKMTAISLYRQGLLFDKNNNNKKAKEKFELLVDRFSDTIDSEIRSLVDNAILRLADDIEDSDRAIPHTLASLEVAKRKADPQLLAQIQFRLATLYNQDEDTYSKSASLFQAAYHNAMKSGDKNLINMTAFQAGQSAYQGNDFQTTISRLETFVDRFPKDSKLMTAVHYLAWSYFSVAENAKSQEERKKLLLQASKQFDHLVIQQATKDRLADWIFQSAQALNMAGEKTKAITKYQQLLTRFPNHNLAETSAYVVPNLQYSTEQFEIALKNYQKFCSQFPKSEWFDEAFYSTATCHEKLGQTEKAMKIYEQTIRRFPYLMVAANAQVNIAHHYFNQKAYNQAHSAYQKLTKQNFPAITPSFQGKVRHWISDTENLLAKAPYQKAITTFSKADNSSANPNEKEKLFARQTIKEFNQLISNYPNCIYVDHGLASIGTAHEILNEWEGAIVVYNQLTARHKNSTPTDPNTKKFLHHAKARLEAIEIFLFQQKRFE